MLHVLIHALCCVASTFIDFLGCQTIFLHLCFVIFITAAFCGITTPPCWQCCNFQVTRTCISPLTYKFIGIVRALFQHFALLHYLVALIVASVGVCLCNELVKHVASIFNTRNLPQTVNLNWFHVDSENIAMSDCRLPRLSAWKHLLWWQCSYTHTFTDKSLAFWVREINAGNAFNILPLGVSALYCRN